MSTAVHHSPNWPDNAVPRSKGRGIADYYLLWTQGIYYGLTGLWPLVSIETFQFVTGRKTDHLPTGHEADHWLVMTVGVLVTAVSLALLTGAWRRVVSPEIAVLGIAAALGLTAIDVLYVGRGVIRPVYLVDAGLEVVLVLMWAGVVLTKGKRSLLIN